MIWKTALCFCCWWGCCFFSFGLWVWWFCCWWLVWLCWGVFVCLCCVFWGGVAEGGLGWWFGGWGGVGGVVGVGCVCVVGGCGGWGVAGGWGAGGGRGGRCAGVG
ncbi:hypothetical protein, partial [Pseudomonas syringae group genomosp. 7]|uniref:hypothetical protein n=1 Tax=Pseudomonas syringae group genomosp. 7 TaxID=251699 RepID=UPI00376FF908